MAPRRDKGAFTRQYHRNNGKNKNSFRHEKEKRFNPVTLEEDGDVLMSGYRIPTIISSKGAIQHKLDRYAPHKGQGNTRGANQGPDRGHGHKRYGGHYDEPRYNHESRFDPSLVDEHNERYGDGYRHHRSNRAEDERHYSNHERSSRHDRHVREYRHAVTSSRSRYEPERASYHSHHHVSTRDERHGRRYDSMEYRSSSQYLNESNSFHHRRMDTGRSHAPPYHDHTRDGAYRASYVSDYSRQRTYGRGSYNQFDHRPNLDFGGGFEGAMKGLASHATELLRDAHWQDREKIQAAVWKAYGDSIASLGYGNSRGLSQDRPRGWFSVDGINQKDDFRGGVPCGPKALREYGNRAFDNRHSNTTDRSRVLEKYQKANKDYERTLNDMFGGKHPHAGTYGNSNTDSSYARPNPRVRLNYDRPGSSQLGSRNSPLAHLDSTINKSRAREDIPRPKPPPIYRTPIYIPDPKDPGKFLNVPRPRMREQWHIPADHYNGEAWADHRKREIETGAFPDLYPDKWFSGDSFGDAAKDSELLGKHGRSTSIEEGAIGRECYNKDTNLHVDDGCSRSRSVASELGHNFNAICLSSTSISASGSSRANSELPEDFDLYGPPATADDEAPPNEPTKTGQIHPGDETSTQSFACMDEDQISQDDDGSMTPRQRVPSPECSFSLSPTSKESIEDDTTTDKDYYHSSREATPTLCLADVIGYTPSTPICSLKNGFNPGGLVDIASSIPPSPNVSRSGAATPLYYQKANYSPLRSRSELYDSPSNRNGINHKPFIGDDWDRSFHSTFNYSNRENPVFISDDEEIKTHHGPATKEGVLVNLNGPEMRSDADTDDDLDFLGLEFFSKPT